VRKPFGLSTQFKGQAEGGDGYVQVFRNGGTGFIQAVELKRFDRLLWSWKVFVPRASSGFDGFPHPVLGQPFIGGPGTACSETYLAIGPFDTQTQAINVVAYINSKLFRFLCLLNKAGQDTPRAVFRYVPRISGWPVVSEADLYTRYGLDSEEVSFIETLVATIAENLPSA
jgi:site-specific DNA-methyltransferase (adenine-specific)